MRKYYEKLNSILHSGAVDRITNLNNGSEAIFKDGALCAKTDDYEECENSIKETISYPPTLVLFGFGHIAKAIYSISENLKFPLFIFDDRKEMLDASYDRATIVIDDYDKIFSRTYSFINPYFLIFTHGHKADESALYYVLSNYESDYVGMIGSKRKIKLTYDNLIKKGIKEETLENVKAPIGLSINAEGPDEIAIAIIAEIIKTYRKDKRQIKANETVITALGTLKPPMILARIISKEGSSPAKVGSEMIITKEAAISTIGGGALELETIKRARAMLESNIKYAIADFNLTEEGELNMACGGKEKVMLKMII